MFITHITQDKQGKEQNQNMRHNMRHKKANLQTLKIQQEVTRKEITNKEDDAAHRRIISNFSNVPVEYEQRAFF